MRKGGGYYVNGAIKTKAILRRLQGRHLLSKGGFRYRSVEGNEISLWEKGWRGENIYKIMQKLFFFFYLPSAYEKQYYRRRF